MAYGNSITAARRMLKTSAARKFRLTCNCGWSTFEEAQHVEQRIERHFSYDDASPWETVEVEPVVAAAPAEGEADGDTE